MGQPFFHLSCDLSGKQPVFIDENNEEELKKSLAIPGCQFQQYQMLQLQMLLLRARLQC